MPNFCFRCGISLPTADITFRAGKESISIDFRCPECKQFAAEDAQEERRSLPDVAADGLIDLVIKDGEELLEKPAETAEVEGEALLAENEDE
ncbi:MAG: hypothetical protein HZA54_12985 [Planctomycetes bacterium]|nr:hypothetical protein [Planctomycetota bacterium]